MAVSEAVWRAAEDDTKLTIERALLDRLIADGRVETLICAKVSTLDRRRYDPEDPPETLTLELTLNLNDGQTIKGTVAVPLVADLIADAFADGVAKSLRKAIDKASVVQ